ncbi:hypothetical protein PoB_005273800 [Plakobranchus ocellatus]|uniref:Uncharacterized protein n=1 Tax=Plakobranchus ocellatus TaxID=259542 RepID=A0AAV4C5G9_9GAST|nr:hypothetical protein PoB_005273800 [Plakobranchus ocellatus]
MQSISLCIHLYQHLLVTPCFLPEQTRFTLTRSAQQHPPHCLLAELDRTRTAICQVQSLRGKREEEEVEFPSYHENLMTLIVLVSEQLTLDSEGILHCALPRLDPFLCR